MTYSSNRRERFRAQMKEARANGSRSWDVSPTGSHPSDLPLTSPARLRVPSMYEERVRAQLQGRGFEVEQSDYEVPDPLSADDAATWTARPDLTVGNIVIEIDSPADRHGGPSHVSGFPAEDPLPRRLPASHRKDCPPRKAGRLGGGP